MQLAMDIEDSILKMLKLKPRLLHTHTHKIIIIIIKNHWNTALVVPKKYSKDYLQYGSFTVMCICIFSASSSCNKAAFDLVVEAINNDHGGNEWPWSTAQLRGYFNYFL